MSEKSAEEEAQLEKATAWIDETKQESAEAIAARTVITRDRFLAELEAITTEQAEFKPSEEEWSVKQVCLHMAHSLRMVTNAIDMLAGGKTLPGGRDSKLGQMDDDPGDFEVVCANVLETFDAAAKSVRQLGENALTNATYEHPLFGEFDCMAWAAFNVLHAKVHVHQLQRVKRTEGFPG